MGPTATTCCAEQAMNLGADLRAAAGRERLWVQTVQTLGADCAAAGRERFFLGADCAAAGRERFFWVQTVQTLGADCAAAGRERFFWVHTMDELEIPKVSRK